MNRHMENSENLCRICGSRFSRHASRCDLCIQYAETLEAAFGTKIQGNQKDVLARPPQTGPNWQPMGSSALVQMCESQCRKSQVSVAKIWLCKQSILPNLHLHWAFSISHANSVETFLTSQWSSAAANTFCGNCLVHQVHSGNCQCHIKTCKSNITVGGIKKPSELLMASLGALQYQCTNGSCSTTVQLQRLQTHLSLCTGAPASLPKAHTPPHITLQQVLMLPITAHLPLLNKEYWVTSPEEWWHHQVCTAVTTPSQCQQENRYAAGTKLNKTTSHYL